MEAQRGGKPIPTFTENQDETQGKKRNPSVLVDDVLMICKVLGQGRVSPSANLWFPSQHRPRTPEIIHSKVEGFPKKPRRATD